MNLNGVWNYRTYGILLRNMLCCITHNRYAHINGNNQNMAICELIYLVIYLVRSPRRDTPQRGIGLGGLVLEKAHPVVPNPR